MILFDSCAVSLLENAICDIRESLGVQGMKSPLAGVLNVSLWTLSHQEVTAISAKEQDKYCGDSMDSLDLNSSMVPATPRGRARDAEIWTYVILDPSPAHMNVFWTLYRVHTLLLSRLTIRHAQPRVGNSKPVELR